MVLSATNVTNHINKSHYILFETSSDTLSSILRKKKALKKEKGEEQEHASAAEMWVIISVKQNTHCTLPISCCTTYQRATYCCHSTVYSMYQMQSPLHFRKWFPDYEFPPTVSPHSTLVNSEITESFVSKKCHVQHVAATSSSLPQNWDALVINLLCCILNFIV